MKYLKMIPLAVLPYWNIILAFIFAGNAESVIKNTKVSFKTGITTPLDIITLIYSIAVLVILIQNMIVTIKGHYTSRESAIMNIIVKAAFLPMYYIMLMLMLESIGVGVFGMILVLLNVVGYLFYVFLSGLNALACTINLKNEGTISGVAAVLMGIGGFIIGIDVVVAIIYVIKSL